VVITTAVCAVVAGYRSYTAIAEWVTDLPADTAMLLGIDRGRRPSESMIRRLLHPVDPDLLAATIGTWLATRIFAGTLASGALLRSLRRRGPATVGERRYAEALRSSRAPRMRPRPKMNSSAGS
jgi:hypothetical protein